MPLAGASVAGAAAGVSPAGADALGADSPAGAAGVPGLPAGVAAGLPGAGAGLAGAVVVAAGAASPALNRSPVRMFHQLLNTQSTIQTAATPIVTLVKTSPALVPNALCPPMPPNAPASPPPRPRWIKTSRIRNTAIRNIRTISNAFIVVSRCLGGQSSARDVGGPETCSASGDQLPTPAAIPKKSAALRLAPPTRAPSTLGCANNSAALSGLTLPPYRILTWAATSAL